MSRLAYFDCASGASGDMILGALVDLGLPLDVLAAELRKIPLEGYRLEARKVQRASLAATKVDVVVEHKHDHGHGPHHHHVGLTKILRMLEASSLSGELKDRAASAGVRKTG